MWWKLLLRWWPVRTTLFWCWRRQGLPMSWSPCYRCSLGEVGVPPHPSHGWPWVRTETYGDWQFPMTSEKPIGVGPDFSMANWWGFDQHGDLTSSDGDFSEWLCQTMGISIPKGRLNTVRRPLLYSRSCFGEECCLKWFSNVLKMFNPWISVKFSQKLMMPTWLLTDWLGQRAWPRFLVPVVAALYGWFMGIAHFIDSRWEEKRESLWWSNLPKSTTISQCNGVYGCQMRLKLYTDIYNHIYTVVEAFRLASLTCWLGQGIRSWEVSCFFETQKQVCCFEDL